jgi:hypothetical protein
MARTAQVAFLGREYDEFLFSSVGEVGAGMPLTVLSALARQGVDPWQEAANLTQMPRDVATQRLASWVAALHDGLLARGESGTIATRLIALLPRRTGVLAPIQVPPPGKGPASNVRPVAAFVIFMAFLIGLQFVIAMGQSTAQVGNANGPASAVASPPLQAPISGR